MSGICAPIKICVDGKNEQYVPECWTPEWSLGPKLKNKPPCGLTVKNCGSSFDNSYSWGCYHRKYLGDTKSCCLGLDQGGGKFLRSPEQGPVSERLLGKTYIDSYRTCSPSTWKQPGGQACALEMQKYCRNSNKLFADSNCKAWCNGAGQDTCTNEKISFCNNPENFKNNLSNCMQVCKGKGDKCDRALKSYCSGDNLTNSNCKQICFSGDFSHDCKDELAKYCEQTANQNKEICNCYLPSETYTKYFDKLSVGLPNKAKAMLTAAVKDPWCLYPDCATVKNKYPPRIDASQCQDLTLCIADVETNSSKIGSINLKQNCGNDFICNDGSNKCPSGYWCDNGVCKQGEKPVDPVDSGSDDGSTGGSSGKTTDESTDESDNSNGSTLTKIDKIWEATSSKKKVAIIVAITVAILIFLIMVGAGAYFLLSDG